MFRSKSPARPLLVAGTVAALVAACGPAKAETLRHHLGEAPRSLAESRPFRLGTSFLAGTVDGAGEDLDPFFPGELHLGWVVGPHLAIGLGGIAASRASTAAGTRWALGAGPFVEGFTFLGERWQPFGQIGTPLQVRFSADRQSSEPAPAFGLAPYAGAGIRYWVADWFTVGVESRVTVVASDGYLAGSRVLPQGAIPWTGGLNLDFHL